MKRFVVSCSALSALFITAAAVTAADDPVAVRKALMQSMAASAATSGAMLKGELDYNPVVAKAALATFNATAHAYGDYFPGGSETGGDTTAAPEIWKDPEGFQEALGKFQTDVAAALEASGKDGPADLAAFQQAVGPVLTNCRSCHEDFRVKNN
ncbi:c-type cytochrome [Chelativorans salis]|uniref:Cytochrome c n=1 Tax=Chelativorans salis TaxID=2978478 RepID=A0ABT2LGY1_9HYPH|nr:cytochrome c [Chelativorans sp. EGI FJ00035]MCT7373464.1 cytochrome c [Chelativorans sp. EGI FJ00035]